MGFFIYYIVLTHYTNFIKRVLIFQKLLYYLVSLITNLYFIFTRYWLFFFQYLFFNNNKPYFNEKLFIFLFFRKWDMFLLVCIKYVFNSTHSVHIFLWLFFIGLKNEISCILFSMIKFFSRKIIWCRSYIKYSFFIQ